MPHVRSVPTASCRPPGLTDGSISTKSCKDGWILPTCWFLSRGKTAGLKSRGTSPSKRTARPGFKPAYRRGNTGGLHPDALRRTGRHSSGEPVLGADRPFYAADRAYIFEYGEDAIYNTFEWCAPGISQEIENLQNIPLEYIAEWNNKFERNGEFYITSLGRDLAVDSPDYRILEAQGIESLSAAPLTKRGKSSGLSV